MAKKSEVNKAQAVRGYFEANPKARNQEVVEALAKHGITISTNYVGNIKATYKRHRAGRKVDAKAGFGRPEVKAALALLKATGSIAAAKQALDLAATQPEVPIGPPTLVEATGDRTMKRIGPFPLYPSGAALYLRLEIPESFPVEQFVDQWTHTIKQDAVAVFADRFGLSPSEVTLTVEVKKGSLWVAVGLSLVFILTLIEKYPDTRKGVQLIWKDLGTLWDKVELAVVKTIGACTSFRVRERVQHKGAIEESIDQFGQGQITFSQFISQMTEIVRGFKKWKEDAPLMTAIDAYNHLQMQREHREQAGHNLIGRQQRLINLDDVPTEK